MLRGFRRGVIGLFIGLLVLSPVMATLTPAVAKAAAENPLDQLEKWFYYRGMRACLEGPYFEAGNVGDDNETISASDINEGHLYIQQRDGTVGSVGAFVDHKEGFGYIAKDLDGLDGSDGTVKCTDGSIWVRGAQAFGFEKVMDLVCAMNKAIGQLGEDSRIDPRRDGGKCQNAAEVYFDGDDGDIFQRALTKALESPIAQEYGGDGDRPDITLSQNGSSAYDWRALYYLLGKNSLETFCGGPLSGAKANDSYDGDNYGVSVYIVEADGTIKKSNVGAEGYSHSYTITKSDLDESEEVNDVYYKSGGNSNEADDVSCADMATLTRENAKAYADWAAVNQDAAQQNENGTQSEDDTGGGTPETTSCAIDGIGWIVCPVMAFIGKMNDAAYGFLRNILAIQPGLINSKSAQNAWAAFRDIANVAFVIAFMVIVYSQLTSAGISNYGVKKMLPRIVIAAILVNISFLICAIAVDVSNIVGSSIYSLLKDSIDVGSEIEADAWGNSIDGILKGAAIGIGVALLVVALVMAPMALLAFLVIILIIIARQALVILLVVISPLAFVAYLLPNTENWFKKWWKALTVALMVYPIVGAVFGASTLASRVLTEVAQGGEDNKELLLLMALGVLAVPLFAVPAILKGSLSAAGSIGTKLAGLADRSTRASSNQFSNRAKAESKALGDAMARRALTGDGRLSRTGAKGLYGLGIGGMMRSRAKREDRYKTLSDTADSARDTYLSTDDKSSARRRAAVQAKETAELTTRQNTNLAKSQHLQQNHALHDAAHQSDLQLKDEHAIHTGQSTQAYVQQNAALRSQAVQSGLDASNAEETVKNDATAAHLATNSGIGGQYEQLNASQGELEIARTDSKNAFETSAVGTDVVDRKATAGIQSNIVQKRAETRAVEQNTDLNVQAQAASDTLEATKAEESAFIQELRTDAGAQEYLISQQSPEVQATVRELQSADTQKRVQSQRTVNAQGVANAEYATQVATSVGVAGGLAEVAGGIDSYGARRAVSAAQQVEVEQFVKNVKTEQSTMSRANDDELHTIATNPAESQERRAAAAGMIMKSGSMGSIHRLTEHFKQTIPEGDSERDAVRNIQMQMSDDMSRVPFGFGDRDRSALRRGEFGQIVEQHDADGNVVTDSSGAPIMVADDRTYDEMLAGRVQQKMSAEEWRSMDPDDRTAIMRIAQDNPSLLGTNGQANLMNAFNEIDSTPTVRASTKTDAKQRANEIAVALGNSPVFTDVT